MDEPLATYINSTEAYLSNMHIQLELHAASSVSQTKLFSVTHMANLNFEVYQKILDSKHVDKCTDFQQV